MSKPIRLKKSVASFGKTAAPVLKTVQWPVEVTHENIAELQDPAAEPLQLGQTVTVEGDVYIKKMSFKAAREASKSYEWDFDLDKPENSKVKSVDATSLQARHLLGTVFTDEKGTPMFNSIDDVLDSDPLFVTALYSVADSVNNFMGKSVTNSSASTNSSVSLCSTESVETPLSKPSET